MGKGSHEIVICKNTNLLLKLICYLEAVKTKTSAIYHIFLLLHPISPHEQLNSCKTETHEQITKSKLIFFHKMHKH